MRYCAVAVGDAVGMVAADQRVDFPGLHREVHSLQYLDAVKALFDGLHAQKGNVNYCLLVIHFLTSLPTELCRLVHQCTDSKRYVFMKRSTFSFVTV